jgi:tetratricopeptide (TPR) repeat protein
MQTSHRLHSRTKFLLPVCRLIAIALLAQVITSAVFAQAPEDPERKRAFQLYRDAKYTEALPLFEKLEKVYPEDPQVLETYGMLLFTHQFTIKDAAARKESRRRAREVLLRAKKAGANSPLLNQTLEGIPMDGGSDMSFSTKTEVDEAMREGEAAFAKADYSKAIEMYQRALLLDPQSYEAALFTGDVYFKLDQQAKAGEWFARAIEINPNRETAYRYWGDSLMKQDHLTQAGDKFVEAYIAEPYSRLSKAGFLNWAQKTNVTVAHPRVDVPTTVKSQQSGNVTINIDPNTLKNDDKSGSGAAWVTYGLVRASWPGGEFAKQYPNEKTYRHSLKEEAAAFRAALKVLAETKNLDLKTVDPSLRTLAKLDKEGLLEAFILLALPDEGIANDFPAYRMQNLEKLRRYVVDYVLTGGVGKN